MSVFQNFFNLYYNMCKNTNTFFKKNFYLNINRSACLNINLKNKIYLLF